MLRTMEALKELRGIASMLLTTFVLAAPGCSSVKIFDPQRPAKVVKVAEVNLFHEPDTKSLHQEFLSEKGSSNPGFQEVLS